MKIILAGLDIGGLLEMEELTWQAAAFLILGLIGMGGRRCDLVDQGGLDVSAP